jgi:hypothetical protein
MKSIPVGAELLLADRQTNGRINITKLIFAFRSFADARENCSGPG